MTITGELSGGEQLTATVTDPDGTPTDRGGDPAGVTWRWARGNSATGSFSNIGGATSADYTTVAADVEKYLRATASYYDPEHANNLKSARAVSGPVEASNAAPAFNDGDDTTRTVPENSEAATNVGAAVTASDSDSGDTLTYSLGGTDAGSFDIDSSNGQIETGTGTYDFEAAKNTYSVIVSVHDGKDAAGDDEDPATPDDTITVTINLTNVNEGPTLGNVGDNESVAENTPASQMIATYTASDVDANDTLSTLRWSLEGDDSGDFNITRNADGEGELRFDTAPNFEMPTDGGVIKNSYLVAVKVTDNGNLSDTSAVITVRVTNVNEAPTITSPPNTATFDENGTVTVVDFDAEDVDDGTTLTWSVEPADDGSKFQIDDSSGELTFTNPPDFETPNDVGDTAGNNTYVVTVKVEDDGVTGDTTRRSHTHILTVTVTNVNEAPVITTDETTYTAFGVDENTDTSTIIKTYEATDEDADTTLTWSLEGTDLGDFTITENIDGHGELRFDNVPNYEDAADADKMNDYDINVKVKDNGIPENRNSSNHRDATLSVTVAVEDANDRPVVSGDNDPDFPEIEFDLDGGALTTEDLTVDGIYTFTDEDGDDVNWSLMSGNDDDANHFVITEDADGNGVLTFRNPSPNTNLKPADRENPVDMGSGNDYEVTVEATDDNPLGNLTGNFTVTVRVTNVDETPKITTVGPTYEAPTFDEIEYDAETADLDVVTYAATDEEGEAISWSLSGDDAGDFTIDSSGGLLSFRNRPNYEDPMGTPATPGDDPDNTYEFVVKATDASTSGNTARNTRELPVTVTVMDVNETPEVSGPADDTDFPETPYDSDEPPAVVATFTARDEEMQDITWSLGGADAGVFIITKDADGAGVVTFTTVNVPEFKRPDFERPEDLDNAGMPEGDGTYEITVEASDGPNTGTWDYAVTVTGVNEKPRFTGVPETTLVLNEHDANDTYTTTTLTSYSAHDEEGGVTWSLSGTDASNFEIAGNGVVTFAAAPSFEDRIDTDGKSVYEFTVVATEMESGSLDASVEVMVEVLDLEEEGTITVNNLNPELGGESVTFTLTDPDGSISFDEVDSCTSTERWDLQLRAPDTSAWNTTCWGTPLNPTFIYEPHEFHSNRHLRAIATYTDRRGGNKYAESPGTEAVAADPSPNVPPVFRNQAYPSMPEGPAGRMLPDPLLGADRDRDTLTYGIMEHQNDDAAYFAVNPTSGQVTVVSELDYELGKRTLTFTATLHDGKGVVAVDDGDGNVTQNVVDDDTVDVTLLMTVSVDDVEEEGVVTLPEEEHYIGLLLEATLTDGDGRIQGERWQWARSSNGSTNWVNISGATSASYTIVRSDAGFFLRALVTYADNRIGVKSAEAITAQRVFGDNLPPIFPSSEEGQRSVPENTGANVNIGAPVAAVDPERNRLTYSLSGRDADAFSIVTSSGQIRTREDMDFEMTRSYSVTVEVHDGRDGFGSTTDTIDDSQVVVIMVENVEEPGVVTLTTDTQSIQASVPVTALLEDDDGGISGTTWQWSRSPNGRTGWVNIATSDTYTPMSPDVSNYIRATATYTDGHGPNKTADAVSPRVGDPPSVNSAPAFPATETGQREAPEKRARIHDRRGPRCSHRLRRRLPHLLPDRDGRCILRHQCGHRATQSGAGRKTELRGQAILPPHRAGHRRRGPERQRRHGRDRRHHQRDRQRDGRQRGARRHRRRSSVRPGEHHIPGSHLHRRGPGGRHHHLVCQQRGRFLDLGPGPALLPRAAQLRGQRDPLPGDRHGHRRRRKQPHVGVDFHGRHGGGRGRRGDVHHYAAAGLGRR